MVFLDRIVQAIKVLGTKYAFPFIQLYFCCRNAAAAGGDGPDKKKSFKDKGDKSREEIAKDDKKKGEIRVVGIQLQHDLISQSPLLMRWKRS